MAFPETFQHRPIFRLSELVIDRVDLVDKGANGECHITLWKRDDRPGPSKPVTVPHDIAKAGSHPVGRTSISKGFYSPVVIEHPDDPAEVARKLPKIAKLRAVDSLQVSADEAMTRALLALLPTTFERHAMLRAIGMGDGRGPAVLRKGQTLEEWDAMWAKREAIWKAREAREEPAEQEDDALSDFARQIELAGEAVRRGNLSAEERQVLRQRGKLTPYVAALTVAEMRNPAAALAWANR